MDGQNGKRADRAVKIRMPCGKKRKGAKANGGERKRNQGRRSEARIDRRG
jgi:hypothetical protein